jgi:glucose-6-phosphate 1-dehydrogenase
MRRLPPAILVIFGITGDLARRYLLKSIYDLAASGGLPEPFRIVGVTRSGTTPEQIIEDIKSAVNLEGQECQEKILSRIRKSISVIKMDITDEAEYKNLKVELDKIEDSFGECMTRLFYLAVPSQMFIPIVKLLGEARLNTGCQHHQVESRLLIEKPMGYDLDSANELIEVLMTAFKQEQIYLVDHYLTKPGVSAIQKFRFEYGKLEHLFNHQHVSHISVITTETIGIEDRAIFYEQSGALRDFLQNHLLQMLAILAMDKPASDSSNSLHAAKTKLLQSVLSPAEDKIPELTIRGQYKGYKEEVDNADSMVETFAAMVVSINNERWRGIPVLLATGKSLDKKRTEIQLTLGSTDNGGPSRQLVIGIEPSQKVELDGKLIYGQAESKHTNAYPAVLAAAFIGDQKLFASTSEVLASWKIVQPVLDAWTSDKVPLEIYKPGSSGPESFNKLIDR